MKSKRYSQIEKDSLIKEVRNCNIIYNIILPAILLSFFLSFSGTLLFFLRDWLWERNGFSIEEMQHWKNMFLYPLSSIGGVILVLISLKWSVKKCIFFICGTFSVVFLALAIVFINLFEAMPPWLIKFSVLVSSFWGPLSMIIYWGFLNDNFEFKKAGKFYPFLATIPVFGFLCAQSSFVSKSFAQNYPQKFLISSFFLAFIFVLISIGIVFLAYKSLDEKRIEEKKQLEDRKETKVFFSKKIYLFFMAILFSMSGFATVILSFDWKHLIYHFYHNSQELGAFLKLFREQSLFVSSVFFGGVILVPILFNFWGWRRLTCLSPIILLLLALLFYSLYSCGENAIYILEYFGNDYSLMALRVGSAYMIFQKSCATILIEPFNEMTILPLQKKYRFTIRLILGIFIIPFITQVGKFFIIFSLTFAVSKWVLGLFVILSFLLWIWAIQSIGKKLYLHDKFKEFA